MFEKIGLLENYYLREFDKAINRDIMDKIRVAECGLAQSVCPIYLIDYEGRISLIGSSILIRFGDSSFIVSASHVVHEKRNGTLFIVERKNSIPLDFDFHTSSTEGYESGKPDKIDFAFARLQYSLVSQFETYRFLDSTEIDPNFDPKSQKRYTFLGYPGTQNKYNNIGKPIAHSYSGPILDIESYSINSIEPPYLYIAIECDDKKTMNDKEERYPFPKPYGMSGGGVWGWSIHDPIGLGNHRVSSKLSGIIIEMTSNEKVWIAIRVTLILEAIRDVYPYLSNLIPTTENLKVNLINRAN